MLENKNIFIVYNEEEVLVDIIKISETLNRALVFIPDNNKLIDVYIDELIIKDKDKKSIFNEKNIEIAKEIASKRKERPFL